MAVMTKLQHWLFTVIVAIISNTRRYNYFVDGKAQVPCLFIFGDSLVDSGNNNNLKTNGKVNYPPYGIDFPDGPTGRYCNGRTVADVLGEFMGIEKFVKSFSTVKNSEILKGVNYASGYAGIQDESGRHMGARVPFNKQLKHHGRVISRIAKRLGDYQAAANYLHKCLYLSVIGNNDYINNYFLPQLYNTSTKYTPHQYADLLIQKYSQQIKVLHSHGARKVGLLGVSAIGCTPNATAFYGTNGSLCVDKMNDAAGLFNSRLQSLVDKLNQNLTDAKFVYLDAFTLTSEYFELPWINITVCCPVNEFGLCSRSETPCPFRHFATFWDSLHPSEFFNIITATILYPKLKIIL